MKAKLLGAALAALLGTSVVVLAEDTPAKGESEAPKAEKQEAKVKEVRFLPYRELASLTDEQKAQINEIHARYVAERKKLEEQEHAELKALLTPEQVAELQQVEEKRAAERKARAAERREQQARQAGREEVSDAAEQSAVKVPMEAGQQ